MSDDYGKGSKRRPAATGREELDREWSRIFGGADPSKEPRRSYTAFPLVRAAILANPEHELHEMVREYIEQVPHA
jgi:hypothetical protein